MSEEKRPNQNEEYTPYYLTNREEEAQASQPQVSLPQPEKPVPAPQPIYYAEAAVEEKPVRARKRKGLRKAIAAIVIVALLAGATGTLSLFYEIVPGEGNTVFSISRRDSGNIDENDQLSINLGNDSNPGNGPRQGSTGAADGPQMEISQAPTTATPSELVRDNGAALTIPEIAAKVMPSTVGVVSSVESMYGTASSSGTGIIMSQDGYIITNNHVINGAAKISIIMMDGVTYDAKLIGADARSDLAVIKIEATGLTPAEFGDSDALRVGDPAVAIGNPLGMELKGTVTDGIISAINRDVMVEERTMTLIQTNAAINAGNSGGPLINQYGQVIGINTLKMQDYYTNIEGLGFAIPTNTAKEIIDELIANGYIKGRPAIGITDARPLSEAQARYYKVPQGVVVYSIDQRSDAYAKGLKINDIITKAQGKAVLTTDEINRIKEQYVAGDDFTLTVYRAGEYMDITFKLMDEAEMTVVEENPFRP